MKETAKKCSTDQRFILKEITSLKTHTLVVRFDNKYLAELKQWLVIQMQIKERKNKCLLIITLADEEKI